MSTRPERRGFPALRTAVAILLAGSACSIAPAPDDLTRRAVNACDAAVVTETGQPAAGMLVAEDDGTVLIVELWLRSDELNVEPPDYRCVARADPAVGTVVESLERVRPASPSER